MHCQWKLVGDSKNVYAGDWRHGKRIVNIDLKLFREQKISTTNRIIISPESVLPKIKFQILAGLSVNNEISELVITS